MPAALACAASASAAERRGDGLLVAQAGQHARLGGGAAGGQRQNALAQRGNALAGERRGVSAGMPATSTTAGYSGRPRPGRILFDGHHGGTALDGGQQTALLVVERLGCVQHNQHQRGVGQRLAAAMQCPTARLLRRPRAGRPYPPAPAECRRARCAR